MKKSSLYGKVQTAFLYRRVCSEVKLFVSATNILPLAVAADISEPTIKYNIPADCREKLTPCHIIAFMCSDKQENRAVIALNLFLGDTR